MDEPSEMKARLARLQAELGQDLPVIARLGQTIAASDAEGTRSAAELALLAVNLHRYYTAIETALERIERCFAAAPTGPNWRERLLEGAALDLPAIRPAILTAAAVAELREILKFRHFFRHAYSVDLDATRLLVIVGHVRATRVSIDESLRAFADVVAALGQGIGQRSCPES